jgi:hypothetical protein
LRAKLAKSLSRQLSSVGYPTKIGRLLRPAYCGSSACQ